MPLGEPPGKVPDVDDLEPEDLSTPAARRCRPVPASRSRSLSRRNLIPLASSRVALSAIAAAAFLTVTIAGCGPSGSTPGASKTDGSDSPAKGYPAKVANCGGEISVTKAPQRIVAMNQSSTETLLSLGLGDRMVGTSTWFDPVLPRFTEQNSRIPRLADNNPSMETVLGAKPDFVAATYFADLPGEGSTKPEAFTRLGVPVYMAPAECAKSPGGKGDGERTAKLSLDAIYQEVAELASLTGRREAGEEMVASLKKRVEAVSGQGKKHPVTAAFWFASSESPYVAGGLGSPQIAAEAVGMTNVYAGSQQEWPQVGWEDFATKDPDVIVIADLARRRKSADSGDEKIDFLEKHPVTSQMRAVKNKQYIRLAGSELNPSIRTVDSMEKLAAGIEKLGLRS